MDQDIARLVESLDPATRTLVAEVDLSNEAREFLNTNLGRYLVGCAQQERAEALEALSRVSPWRWRKIRDLQARVWRAESFLGWLKDIVVSGVAASQILDEVHRE